MTATDKNHAKAEIKAFENLLRVVSARSLLHRDGRDLVLEAINNSDAGGFIRDLTFALRDSVDSDDEAEIGRIVRKYVMERLRALPQFEIEFGKALADLDEQDRADAEADEEFERDTRTNQTAA